MLVQEAAIAIVRCQVEQERQVHLDQAVELLRDNASHFVYGLHYDEKKCKESSERREFTRQRLLVSTFRLTKRPTLNTEKSTVNATEEWLQILKMPSDGSKSCDNS
jgi:hypothetical protein